MDAARQEILASKQRIEAVLGTPVRTFAYPNGEAGDFAPAHEVLLAEMGFEAACTTLHGVNNSATNRYALRRLDARDEPPSRLAARLRGLRS